MSAFEVGDSYYEVLGVSATASHEEIKKAWVTTVRGVHADKSNDSDRYEYVLDAGEVLKDAEKRKAYDVLGHDEFITKYGRRGNKRPIEQRDVTGTRTETRTTTTTGATTDSTGTGTASGNTESEGDAETETEANTETGAGARDGTPDTETETSTTGTGTAGEQRTGTRTRERTRERTGRQDTSNESTVRSAIPTVSGIRSALQTTFSTALIPVFAGWHYTKSIGFLLLGVGFVTNLTPWWLQTILVLAFISLASAASIPGLVELFLMILVFGYLSAGGAIVLILAGLGMILEGQTTVAAVSFIIAVVLAVYYFVTTAVETT